MVLGVKNECTPVPGIETECTPVEGGGWMRVAMQGSGAGRRERAMHGADEGRGGVERCVENEPAQAWVERWKAAEAVPGVESEPVHAPRSGARRGGAAAVQGIQNEPAQGSVRGTVEGDGGGGY